jgi:hypothetical protein
MKLRYERGALADLDEIFAYIFHPSQSLFTLRHTRLTTSLPTAPPNSALSARRTRRVLVPERYVLHDRDIEISAKLNFRGCAARMQNSEPE